MLGRTSVLLRNQLEANPEVLPEWPVGGPAFAVFAWNDTDDEVTLHVKGGQSRSGPFVREYAADSIITIAPKARSVPAVISDIPRFLALHLGDYAPEGVRVEIVAYTPGPVSGNERETLST